MVHALVGEGEGEADAEGARAADARVAGAGVGGAGVAVADAARAVCAPAVGARTGPMRRGAPRWEASCKWTRCVHRTGPGRSQRAHRALLAAADRGLRGLPSTTWQLWKSARVSSNEQRCQACAGARYRYRVSTSALSRTRAGACALSLFSLFPEPSVPGLIRP